MRPPEESEDAEGNEDIHEEAETPIPKISRKKPTRFDAEDVLYQDDKRVVQIRITVKDLIGGNDELNLFMSAIAPSLMPESIAAGTPE